MSAAGCALGHEPAGIVPNINDHDRNFYQAGSQGLTKRELIAAMAMQGLVASGRSFAPGVAEVSVAHADALLAELAKGCEA